MTAILPLPWAASGLSLVIAEKSLVNEVTDSCGTLAAAGLCCPVGEDDPLGVVPPPPQAAAASVVAASTATSETFRKTRTVAPSLFIAGATAPTRSRPHAGADV